MRPLVTWLSLAAFLATAIPTALHAEAPTTPPDVVLFAKGGMLRGTISESDPDGDVVIVLVTGETRRVPMSDVKYAGPADEAPKKKAPAPRPAAAPPAPAPREEVRPLVTIRAREARLRLIASEPDITFHLRSGQVTGTARAGGRSARYTATAYDRMCTAPCEANIGTGTYRLALSHKDGSPVEAPDSLSIRGPSTVSGTYTSYSGLRTVGWIAAGAGAAIGGGLIIDAAGKDDASEKILVGGLVATGGLLLGLILASKSDEARIVVSPLATSRRGPQLATADASWSRRLGLEGITVGARF